MIRGTRPKVKVDTIDMLIRRGIEVLFFKVPAELFRNRLKKRDR